MKSYNFIILLCLVLNIGIDANSQSIQGTFRNGSVGNSVFVSMRPTANVTGSLTDFQFAISIPVSTAPSAPSATFAPLINGVSVSATGQLLTTEMVGGVSSYVYTFSAVGTGVLSTTYNLGTTYNVGEVFFTGANPGTTANLRMIQLPNGGSSGQSNFYVAFNTNPDATAVTPFFGTGAVNDGNSYSGFSFVPLAGVSLPTKFSNFFAIKKEDNADFNLDGRKRGKQ